MSMFTLGISCLTTSNLLWFMDLCNTALYSIGPCFYHQSHPRLSIVFALAPSLHSFWNYFSTDLQEYIGHLLSWEFIFQCPIILLFHCSWGSQGKNTEVVCHSLLQWTTFCSSFSFNTILKSSFSWPAFQWLSYLDGWDSLCFNPWGISFPVYLVFITLWLLQLSIHCYHKKWNHK